MEPTDLLFSLKRFLNFERVFTCCKSTGKAFHSGTPLKYRLFWIVVFEVTVSLNLIFFELRSVIIGLLLLMNSIFKLSTYIEANNCSSHLSNSVFAQ